jgi:hypothetical protein
VRKGRRETRLAEKEIREGTERRRGIRRKKHTEH